MVEYCLKHICVRTLGQDAFGVTIPQVKIAIIGIFCKKKSKVCCSVAEASIQCACGTYDPSGHHCGDLLLTLGQTQHHPDILHFAKLDTVG